MENIMREIQDVLESERLVTARLVESVVRTAQLAGGATPEMQELFGQWASLISGQILRECEGGEIDIPSVAEKIGVNETTVLSLVLFLQRNGKLRAQKISFSDVPPCENEVCACMKEG